MYDSKKNDKNSGINCSACNCKYNDCGCCSKDGVSISGSSAKKSCETCCDDFKM